MSTVVAMAKKWQIAQTLRDEILRGKFAASDRFPSERALVRRFSVARETVRAALRELAEEHAIRDEFIRPARRKQQNGKDRKKY